MLARSHLRQAWEKQHHAVIEPAVVHDRIEPTIRDVSARKGHDRARVRFFTD
jgi:hypothetical protein